MKKILPFLIALAVVTSARAFSFSTEVASGQTLYFTVTSSAAVKVVAPAGVSWSGYSAPTGALVIPPTVNNNGTSYSVTAIDKMAFQECYGLESVVIPGSVVSVGQRAFAMDTMLASVTMNAGVQRIDMMAFIGCTSLNTISLPSTLTRIAISAFENTGYYNNAANWTSGKELILGTWLIQVGNTVTGMVEVPEGVVGIANSALLYCRYMDKVELPTTMHYIGEGAFAECYALDTVRLRSTTPPQLSDDSFLNVDPLPVLAVPCGTSEIYSVAAYWSAFPVVEDTCLVSIDEVEASTPMTVLTAEGGVVVQGAGGMTLTLCDMMGRTVCVVKEAADVQYLPLPAAGFYVLLPSEGAAQKISYWK